MTRERLARNGFHVGGAELLRRGIEKNRDTKLRAIVEKLRDEQDPMERKKLFDLHDEAWKTADGEIKRIRDLVF